MPRTPRCRPDQLVGAALSLFWAGGYGTTSIEELTRRTGTSRHALYAGFGDKRTLLLASLEAYRREIVDPAFAPVEQPGAGLPQIGAYFEAHIAAAEAAGLPGRGCLLVNLTTEVATRDGEVAAAVRAHLDRLRAGFAHALAGAGATPGQAEGWAELLAAIAQGLWSLSRVCDAAAGLRRPVAALLALIEGALAR